MHKLITTTLLVLFVGLIACKKKTEDTSVADKQTQQKQEVVANYANIVQATYQDALSKAQILKTTINDFIANPTDAKFTAVKNAYIDARTPYEQSESFRFYGGPIDDDVTGVEGLLNSWPMDEGYIDYIVGYPNSGIINDPVTHPTINKDTLEALNSVGSETNISVGYHAIEFLLWGQDLSATGPGARPYTDYVTGGTGTASNQDRRGAYLKACAELLVQHLQTVADAWAPNADNYRKAFIAAPADSSLRKIFLGIGSFSKGELAGERMSVALSTQEQEEEHSCFSDQTDVDIKLGAKSIQNVWTGKYIKADGTVIQGTSLSTLVASYNAQFGGQLDTQIDETVQACNAVQHPFDQQILGTNPTGRANIQTAIDKLKTLGDMFVTGAAALGITNVTIQ